MTTATQGQPVVLTAQFYAYLGGPLMDVTGITIQITSPTGGVEVAPTSTGVTHPATGTYEYTWPVPQSGVPGDHLAVWAATEASASDVVTVESAASSGTYTEVWYCTREDVKRALDVAAVARTNEQIDREIQSASRSIEGLVGRFFYPWQGTQYLDWPDHQYAAPWRLWLDRRELTSVAAVVAAGVDITGSVMLRPDDAPMRGEPYSKIEIDLSSIDFFNSGATFQRAIAITGTFGYCAAETPGGSVVSTFTDAAGTTGTCSDSSRVGVGTLLRVDGERMIVTGRQMTSTGQTITGNLTAQTSGTVIPVSSSAAFQAAETILVDGEKMSIQEIVGGQLVVVRGWDGSTVAAHTSGATINAPRLVTVQRGVLGTVAAPHSANSLIAVHVVPSLIRDLAIAETMNKLWQEKRSYTQTMRRGGDGASDPRDVSSGLSDLRRQVTDRYRRLRTRTTARLV